jgi:prolyl oligopeptidase
MRSGRRRTRTGSCTRAPTSRTGVFAAGVTDDGRYLVLTQWEGTNRESRIFVRDLQDRRSEIVPFLDRFDASDVVVGNDGPVFYVVTDKDAGRNRMVTIDLARPGQESWTDVIPELPGRDVLGGAVMIGQRFLTVGRSDAHDLTARVQQDGPVRS